MATRLITLRRPRTIAPMRTIIGRDAELAAVRAFLARDAGGCGVLLLEGDAGIGKTTVWEAAASLASKLGYRVLTARPLEMEARISFAAAGDLLAGVLDELGDELPAPQRRALEVALLLRDPGGPAPGPQAVAFGFLSALRAVARSRPTLVAVDDLHWLDHPSAGLLAFAARRLGDEPIRLLLARRTAGAGGAPGLDAAIEGERTERIALQALSEGALQRIFREQLDVTFPRPVLHRINATSGGNPFHALELGRALARRGGKIDPGEPLPVSATLAGLVGEHLAALPGPAARALEIASLSAEPTLSLLAETMGEPADLAPAVAEQIVTIEGERVSFAHSLYSSAVAANLGGERRRDVHRRLARAGSDPEEQAHHLALSVSGPDSEVAATLEAAAAAARARGAPTAGAELLEHAVRLSPGGASEIVRLTIDAADAHFEAGDTRRALALLEALVDRDVASGGDRAEVLYRLATVRVELDRELATSIGLFERALAEPSLDPGLEVRIHSELAWLAMFVDDLSYGLRQARLAVAIAERADSRRSRAEARIALLFVQFLAGEPWPEGGLDAELALEAAGERFRIDRSPSLVAGARLLWSGELAARQRFEAVCRLALERGDETNVSIARYHLAYVALVSGDAEAAAGHVREAVMLAGQTGVNTTETRLVEAALAAHRGQVEAAVAAATDLLAEADHARDPINALRALAILGFAEHSRRRGPEALGHLERAPRGLRPARDRRARRPALHPGCGGGAGGPRPPGRRGGAPGPVRASRAPPRTSVGGRDRRPLPGAHPGRERGPRGRARRARTGAARPRAAPVPVRARPHAARAGDRPAPREAPARGEGVAGGGAPALRPRGRALWAEHARTELGRIGGRASSGRGLTPTERRLAELVAGGATNREAAATLFVTVHTVEAALTRIYGKLGVRSRTELANRLAEPEGKL